MESQKESLWQKIHRRVIPAYKNSKFFLWIFFVGIPLSFSPISYYLSAEIFNTVSIIPASVIIIFIFLNLKTINSTLKGLKDPSTSDYLSALSVLEKMPKIQMISAIILGVTILGLLLLSNIPQENTSTSELIRTLLLNTLIPSLVILVFSSIHMLIPPTRKNLDLNLSKAWIMSIEPKNSDSKKIKHLMNCIENYDDFLQSSLKQRINNLDQIYTKFVLDTSKDLHIIITEIKERYNQGEFSILRYLQDYKKDDEEDKTPLLIKQSKHFRFNISIERLQFLIITIAYTTVLIIKELLPVFFPNLNLILS